MPRIGTRYPDRGQTGQLFCGAVPSALIHRVTGGADHGPEPAHHRGRGEHLWGLNRRYRHRRDIAARQPGQFGNEHRRKGLIAGAAVDRGDQQPLPGPAHRHDQQPALLGQQWGAHRHVRTEAVQDVEQALGSQNPAARSDVGPQPVLQTCDHDHLPVAAERGVRAEHRHRLPGRRGIADRRQLQGRHMFEQTRQRCSGGTGNIGLGDIEQRGDRAEIALSQRTLGAPAIGDGNPAPLQAAALPRLPQREPWIVVTAVAAGGRGEHRTHPLDRCRQGGRQLRCRAGECLAQRPIVAPQRAAQLAQRHRIHPADGSGQQCVGGVVVEAAFGGGQHAKQRADAGLIADRAAQRRLIDRHPGHRQ